MLKVNLLPDNHVDAILLADEITVIENEMTLYTSRFVNILFPIKQI